MVNNYKLELSTEISKLDLITKAPLKLLKLILDISFSRITRDLQHS